MKIKVGDYYKKLLSKDANPSLTLYCLTNGSGCYITEDGVEIEGMRGKVKRIYSPEDIKAIFERKDKTNPFKKDPKSRFVIEAYSKKDGIAYRYNSAILAARALNLSYSKILSLSLQEETLDIKISQLCLKRGWNII